MLPAGSVPLSTAGRPISMDAHAAAAPPPAAAPETPGEPLAPGFIPTPNYTPSSPPRFPQLSTRSSAELRRLGGGSDRNRHRSLQRRSSTRSVPSSFAPQPSSLAPPPQQALPQQQQQQPQTFPAGSAFASDAGAPSGLPCFAFGAPDVPRCSTAPPALLVPPPPPMAAPGMAPLPAYWPPPVPAACWSPMPPTLPPAWPPSNDLPSGQVSCP